MRKYRTWASSMRKGKVLWGDIFPDGEVPIQSIITQSVTLEGIDKTERVFLVDWMELSSQKQTQFNV